MSQSIFSGLWLSRCDGQIEISYPNRICDFARARMLAQAHGIEVSSSGTDTWTVRHPPAEETCPEALKAFFADLNGFPQPYPPFDPRAVKEGEPVVTCIIIVNENLPFVREQLLPSLFANSTKFPIEIVVVCNGSVSYEPELAQLRSIRSDWGIVSKAYNAGARISRGRYLAFFHDDCIVCDPLWIEKSLQRLTREAHAVAGEYRRIETVCGVSVPELPVAKCVPLVIRRADFEAVGGFDEYHYIGFEDFDFTLALASRRKKLVATDINVLHFHGMSSTLKYNPVPGLRELYALSALPRDAIMRRFKEFWDVGVVSEGINYMQLASDVQLLYVFRKYRDFLQQIDKDAYARAEAALEREVAKVTSLGPERVLARFRELDRRTWDAAQGFR